MTTITDNIEKQLLDNITDALNHRANAEESLRLANQCLKDAIQIAFKYDMRPARIILLLDDVIDYHIEQEIVNEYKPKNRSAWRAAI
jgi:hypothetical protein